MIKYRVYVNDYHGGPVDLTTPIYDGPLLTFAPAAIPVSSDATFLVRAYDSATGLQEKNVQAVFRIATNGAGVDVTNLQNGPRRPQAYVEGSGGARVWWRYFLRGSVPNGFHVYAGTPTVNYGSILATVPYYRQRAVYSTLLTGLTPGSPYLVGVRAYGTLGEEGNTLTFPFTPLGGGSYPAPDAGSGAFVLPAPGTLGP